MRILVLLATLIVALIAPRLTAQSHFSARSDLVVLNVAVTDSRGGFVSGLPQDAFKVVDEGRAAEDRILRRAGRACDDRAPDRLPAEACSKTAIASSLG